MLGVESWGWGKGRQWILRMRLRGKEVAVKDVVKLLLEEIHCGECVHSANEFALSLCLFLNFNISLQKNC